MNRMLLVTGSLRSDDELAVSSKVIGKVDQVFVKEGDRVGKGQLLVSLDPTAYQAQVEQAKAGLQTAQIRYDQAKQNEQLRNTQTSTGIAEAQQAVTVAQAHLAQAQASDRQAASDLARWQQLYNAGAVSAQELDTKRTAADTARADVTVATQTLAQVQQALKAAQATQVQYQLTQEDIKAAAQAVEQARAQVAVAQEQLQDTRIVSPLAGVVYQRQVDVGETVTPGQPFLNMAGMQSVYFEAEVPETEVADLRMESPVTVTVDALPGREFNGRVVTVIPVATAITRTFRVRVQVVSVGDVLAPGSFVRGNVLIGQHLDALLLPKDAVQSAVGENYVFVVAGGRAHRVPVTLGWGDTSHVEALSGIHEGDQVVVVGGSSLRDGDLVKVIR